MRAPKDVRSAVARYRHWKDQILQLMRSREELLTRYMAHTEASRDGQVGADMDAWEAMNSLIEKDPDSAWEVVNTLIERASDENVLSLIAAGPLEDLICRHPEQMIERMERKAAEDRRFRYTLGGVWGWSSLPEAIRARLDAAVASDGGGSG